ncbi:hypothetical protein FGO68_gene17690 [Halteria grandinella]|uniref:Uncharacterized protein n=1 Tax=Halteria grandinella TaxID=5974 RepID=A0A8J8T4R9_HALGN|nr:hypothetical protein FGO68_gene17690 [Halteria grandinella]
MKQSTLDPAPATSGDFARRYRAVYERDFEQRHILKNHEHPSPRFFISNDEAPKPLPSSISTIPLNKGSINEMGGSLMLNQQNQQSVFTLLGRDTIQQQQSIQQQQQQSIQHAVVQNMVDARQLRGEKVKELERYQQQQSRSRERQVHPPVIRGESNLNRSSLRTSSGMRSTPGVVSGTPVVLSGRVSEAQVQMQETFKPLNVSDRCGKGFKEVPKNISESVAQQLLGITTQNGLSKNLMMPSSSNPGLQKQSSNNINISEAPTKRDVEVSRHLYEQTPPSHDSQSNDHDGFEDGKLPTDGPLPEFLFSGSNNTFKAKFFEGVSNIDEGTQPITTGLHLKSSLMSSTKELTLKRFIDKHRELLMPNNNLKSAPPSHTPESAAKTLTKLAELERTNHSRLQNKREDALEKVVTILEEIQLYHAFKHLSKN